MRLILSLVSALMFGLTAHAAPLRVSDDGRTFFSGDAPFFWLGDTAWLMLSRLDREDTEHFLDVRQEQGFNVLQIMVLHTTSMSTASGVPALTDKNIATPHVTPGSDPEQGTEYDYWDHLDWVLERAAERGIHLALVPIWGSITNDDAFNQTNAAAFGTFLAERYGARENIIWLNGGDTYGSENTIAWSELGRSIKQAAPQQLMTFHPRGRTDSAFWFHRAPWLDFNMYQSGHKSYDQDPDARGENNWTYAEENWARVPYKPFLDGEPSYENIPHGLHDGSAPKWRAADVRRYAWWSVLSGAAGHTYGENSVMQMFVPRQHEPAYHAVKSWKDGIFSKGAMQMKWLKALVELRNFADRQPDPALVLDNGTRYDHVAVLRGSDYLMAYTYSGRSFQLRLGILSGENLVANWYSPRDGSVIPAGTIDNQGAHEFDPPGYARPGNDWVLLLDDAAADLPQPKQNSR